VANTILLIDDDPRLIVAVKESLELLGGFRVVTAMDGIRGLEVCMAEHPDVAVIDVKMPQLDGYQVVRALRGDHRTTSLPLIILSALTQEHHLLMGMLSGADRYLEKPVHPQQLVDAIHQVLQISQQQRDERMDQLTAEEE
jgi:DNA-binding response OmpR family regulator